jgi:hypothetical protein
MRFPTTFAAAAVFGGVGAAVHAAVPKTPVSDLPAAFGAYLKFEWAVLPALALVALLVTSVVYGIFMIVRLSKVPVVAKLPHLVTYGWLTWLGWFLANHEPRFTPFAIYVIDRFSSPIFWGAAAALAVVAIGAGLALRKAVVRDDGKVLTAPNAASHA